MKHGLYKYENPGDSKHGIIFKFVEDCDDGECWDMEIVRSNGRAFAKGVIIGCYIRCLKPLGNILNA